MKNKKNRIQNAKNLSGGCSSCGCGCGSAFEGYEEEDFSNEEDAFVEPSDDSI